jgi:hypothetical protein
MPVTDEAQIAQELLCDELSAHQGHMSIERLKLILKMVDDGMWYDMRTSRVGSKPQRVRFSAAQRYSFECVARKALEKRTEPLFSDGFAYSVRDGKIHRGLPT